MEYTLEKMQPEEFQLLIQSLLMAKHGDKCKCFPLFGPDGGRDATIQGHAAFIVEETWIQVKCKVSGAQNNTNWICSHVKKELRQIRQRAASDSTFHPPRGWICYTNIPLSGTPEVGALDRLESILSSYRDLIPEIYVYGSETILPLLKIYPQVAASFSATITADHILSAALKNFSEPDSTQLVSLWPTSLRQYCRRKQQEQDLKAMIDSNRKPVFITGFGGIGKSEFATHMIPSTWPNHAYRVVFDNDLLHTIASVEVTDLKQMDANGHPKTTETLFEERMSILRTDLTAEDIFVVDNYDVMDPFSDPIFEKICNLKAHIVFVGRTAPFEFKDNTVFIDPLSEKELLGIMRFFYTEPCPDQELLELIGLVERHTLTVELMARLLQASRTLLKPSDLKEKLQSHSLSFSTTCVRTEKDRGSSSYQSYAEVQRHLQALFMIARLTSEQQYIMSAASLLPVRGMDLQLFCEFLNLSDMNSINQLIDLGWLRPDAGQTISLHPLISLLCHNNDATVPCMKRCGTFIHSFSQYLKKPRRIRDNSFEITLAKNILELATRDSDHLEYIEFQINYGYFQFLCGNYPESEFNIGSAIKVLWGKKQYTKAILACFDYAAVLEVQRKMEAENELLEKMETLPAFQKQFHRFPDLLFNLLVTRATWLRIQCQQKQAIEKLEAAESLLSSTKGVVFHKKMVAQMYYELSTCKYQIRKEYPGYLKQSEDAAWESIRLRKLYYGEEDVSLANDFNTLGYIYKEKGDYASAEKFQKDGYELRLKYYGEKNIYTCNSLENWAMTISFQINRQNEAEDKFQKALTIKNDILEPDNAWIANSYYQLAKHYQRTEQWENAVSCCQKALNIYQKNEQKFRFSLGLVYYEQAYAYYHLSDFSHALTCAQKAYSMQYTDPNQGPKKPSTLKTASLLQEIDLLLDSDLPTTSETVTV